MQVESVAGAFASYRAQVLPPDASDVQVLECQRAFYAGAYFLLMNIAHNIGDDSTPEEEGIEQLEALKTECEAFAAAGGMPLPVAAYPPHTPAAPWIADEQAPVPPAIVAELERLAMVRRAAAAAGLTPADIHHEAPAPLVADMRPVLERLGHRIGEVLPPGWGFALFLFSFGEGGHTFYIANCDRADVLTALHDFIRRQTS
jgi:hypothetical protein